MLLAAALPVRGWAQTPAAPLGEYKADAKKPVDIQSESLEVDDKRQIAVFRGNVVARQGDYAIRSQELTVTYRKKSTAPAAEIGRAAIPPGGGGADIRFLDAKGEVSVSRAQGFQRARSNSAHFDVQAQTIELFDGVAVSDGSNVIKCERMLIELAAGKSTFSGPVSSLIVPKPDTSHNANAAREKDGSHWAPVPR